MLVAQWNELLAIPNLLSLSRVPLGLLLFANASPGLRFTLIVLAALTDWMDGWLARRWGQSSALGALLDPIGDKAFAGCAVVVAWLEGCLTPAAVSLLLSREIALVGHLLHCGVRRALQAPCRVQVGTCSASKLFTTLQFGVLAALVLQLPVPQPLWAAFPLIAVWAYVQWSRKALPAPVQGAPAVGQA
jgi:cardiolipin synthase